MRVFSSCAGLYVRALFVKKGICACTNLPLNSYPAYYSGPISDEKRDLKQRKRGEKGGQFFRFDGGELLAEWSTRKRDFGFFFHLVVETDLSEKKVVFSFVSGNTQLTFVGENTHQKLCLRRERRKDERERLGREAFVGEKKKKKIRSFLILSFFLLIMSDKEDVSRRPALTNPMATNLRTTGERHQFCSLQGRGALVTGASGGIGLAIVERLAECGVNVCIVARRVEKLNELKEKLETEYPDVTIFPLQLDVSKTSEEEMLKIPEKVPFQVDILVNNAGLALGTEAVDTNSISDAMTVVNTNIMGVVAFTRAFASGMRERDRGHIVNISSIAGHEAYIGGSIYCATKHAVDAFTRSARHDLRNSKVRVSSVSPGAVRTDFTMTRFKGDVDAEAALYRGFDPMIAEDVADQVIYALSRPMRTQVCDIISLANAQSAARDIHRGD